MENTTDEYLFDSTTNELYEFVAQLDTVLYWYGIGAIACGMSVSLTIVAVIFCNLSKLHFRPHLLAILTANIVYLSLLAIRLGCSKLEIDYLNDHLCRLFLYVGEVANQLPGFFMLAVCVEQCAGIFRCPFSRVTSTHRWRHFVIVAVISLLTFVLNGWILALSSESAGQCTLNRRTYRVLVDRLEVAKIIFIDIIRLATIVACNSSLIYKVCRPFRMFREENRASLTDSDAATPDQSTRKTSIGRALSIRLLSTGTIQRRRKATFQLVLIVVVITVCNLPKNVYDLFEILRERDIMETPSRAMLMFFAWSYALFLTQFGITPLYAKLPLFWR